MELSTYYILDIVTKGIAVLALMGLTYILGRARGRVLGRREAMKWPFVGKEKPLN